LLLPHSGRGPPRRPFGCSTDDGRCLPATPKMRSGRKGDSGKDLVGFRAAAGGNRPILPVPGANPDALCTISTLGTVRVRSAGRRFPPESTAAQERAPPRRTLPEPRLGNAVSGRTAGSHGNSAAREGGTGRLALPAGGDGRGARILAVAREHGGEREGRWSSRIAGSRVTLPAGHPLQHPRR
jgi:hypothetical protein